MHERVTRAEKQLAEVRQQLVEIQRQRVGKQDVVAAFAEFDNVCNVLSTREQVQVLQLLISQVEFDLAESSIAMTFHSSATKALAEGE